MIRNAKNLNLKYEIESKTKVFRLNLLNEREHNAVRFINVFTNRIRKEEKKNN